MIPWFIYKIDSRQAPNLLTKSGASFQFILPKEKMIFNPADLLGTVLWIVVEEDSRCYLTQRGQVDSISTIKEGPNDGDFIIDLNKSRTIKTVSPAKEKRKWELTNDQKLKIGFDQCPDEYGNYFESMIKNNIVVRIAEHDTIRQLDLKKWSENFGYGKTIYELEKLNSKASLDDLSTSAKLKWMSPFGFEIYKSYKVESSEEQQLLGIIRAIDPIRMSENHARQYKVGDSETKYIDAELRPTTPDEIIARNFISGSNTVNFEEMLEKTEQAEKLHQEIVRNIAKGLILKKVVPLVSRSVDLAFKNNGVLFVLEVKTIKKENLISQFYKGVSQLLHYMVQIEFFEPTKTKGVLVLGNQSNILIDPLLLKMAYKAGIDVINYDRAGLELLPDQLLFQNYLND